jgi:hypothetical protein
MNAIALFSTNNQLTLVAKYKGFNHAIALLREQYAVGTVEVRIVRLNR